VVEAEAWRDGLRHLGPSPQQKVILETDSLELINLWQSQGEHRSEVKPILKDIQGMTMFYHCSRRSIQSDRGMLQLIYELEMLQVVVL
jgi:hypothetical protein